MRLLENVFYFNNNILKTEISISSQSVDTETSWKLYSNRLEVLTTAGDHDDDDKNIESSESDNATSNEFLINYLA